MVADVDEVPYVEAAAAPFVHSWPVGQILTGTTKRHRAGHVSWILNVLYPCREEAGLLSKDADCAGIAKARDTAWSERRHVAAVHDASVVGVAGCMTSWKEG